jgi:arylsulfatase A-like enzyme
VPGGGAGPAEGEAIVVPGSQPNILVIWGDDIGVTNLSCYSDGLLGYGTPRTVFGEP